jgi:hypothetical protein
VKKKILAWGALILVGAGVPLLIAATGATEPSTDEDQSQPPVSRLDLRPMGPRPDGMPRPRDGYGHEGYGREGYGRDGIGWSRDRMYSTTTRPVTDQEKQDIDKFMQEHSPKRWAKLKDITEDRKNRLYNTVAGRYRAMEELKLSDPKLYEIRLSRMSTEDEIFAIGWDLRNGKSNNTDSLRKDLRKQVRALVDSRLAERRLRVQQMLARAEAEAKQLKNDESNVDKMVERNMSAIEKAQRWPTVADLAPPGMRPFGSGGPGSNPGGPDSRDFAPASSEPAP